jgi:hypothetical protein
MEDKRQELRKMVDALPDDALQRAEQALKYCANPAETRLTIAQAQERVRTRSMKRLEEYSKRVGHGFITVGSGSAGTMPTGDFHSSMSAWDDGPVTYHLRRFQGYLFEMYERLELAEDRKKLVLTQRIVGPNGTEQLLTANIPVPDTTTGR